VEDEQPSPSTSKITRAHDNTPIKVEELAPSLQRQGTKTMYTKEVHSEEEDEDDEKAMPQGDRPFPKWYTQLLDEPDAPNTSNDKVTS